MSGRRSLTRNPLTQWQRLVEDNLTSLGGFPQRLNTAPLSMVYPKPVRNDIVYDSSSEIEESDDGLVIGSKNSTKSNHMQDTINQNTVNQYHNKSHVFPNSTRIKEHGKEQNPQRFHYNICAGNGTDDQPFGKKGKEKKSILVTQEERFNKFQDEVHVIYRNDPVFSSSENTEGTCGGNEVEQERHPDHFIGKSTGENPGDYYSSSNKGLDKYDENNAVSRHLRKDDFSEGYYINCIRDECKGPKSTGRKRFKTRSKSKLIRPGSGFPKTEKESLNLNSKADSIRHTIPSNFEDGDSSKLPHRMNAQTRTTSVDKETLIKVEQSNNDKVQEFSSKEHKILTQGAGCKRRLQLKPRHSMTVVNRRFTRHSGTSNDVAVKEYFPDKGLNESMNRCLTGCDVKDNHQGGDIGASAQNLSLEHHIMRHEIKDRHQGNCVDEISHSFTHCKYSIEEMKSMALSDSTLKYIYTPGMKELMLKSFDFGAGGDLTLLQSQMFTEFSGFEGSHDFLRTGTIEKCKAANNMDTSVTRFFGYHRHSCIVNRMSEAGSQMTAFFKEKQNLQSDLSSSEINVKRTMKRSAFSVYHRFTDKSDSTNSSLAAVSDSPCEDSDQTNQCHAGKKNQGEEVIGGNSTNVLAENISFPLKNNNYKPLCSSSHSSILVKTDESLRVSLHHNGDLDETDSSQSKYSHSQSHRSEMEELGLKCDHKYRDVTLISDSGHIDHTLLNADQESGGFVKRPKTDVEFTSSQSILQQHINHGDKRDTKNKHRVSVSHNHQQTNKDEKICSLQESTFEDIKENNECVFSHSLKYTESSRENDTKTDSWNPRASKTIIDTNLPNTEINIQLNEAIDKGDALKDCQKQMVANRGVNIEGSTVVNGCKSGNSSQAQRELVGEVSNTKWKKEMEKKVDNHLARNDDFLEVTLKTSKQERTQSNLSDSNKSQAEFKSIGMSTKSISTTTNSISTLSNVINISRSTNTISKSTNLLSKSTDSISTSVNSISESTKIPMSTSEDSMLSPSDAISKATNSIFPESKTISEIETNLFEPLSSRNHESTPRVALSSNLMADSQDISHTTRNSGKSLFQTTLQNFNNIQISSSWKTTNCMESDKTTTLKQEDRCLLDNSIVDKHHEIAPTNTNYRPTAGVEELTLTGRKIAKNGAICVNDNVKDDPAILTNVSTNVSLTNKRKTYTMAEETCIELFKGNEHVQLKTNATNNKSTTCKQQRREESTVFSNWNNTGVYNSEDLNGNDIYQFSVEVVQPKPDYSYCDIDASSQNGGDNDTCKKEDEFESQSPDADKGIQRNRTLQHSEEVLTKSSSNDDLYQSSLECLLEQLIQRGKIATACIIGTDRQLKAYSKYASFSDNDINALCDGAMGRYDGLMKITLSQETVFTCFQCDDYRTFIGRSLNSMFVSKLGLNILAVGFSPPNDYGSCIKEMCEFAEVLKGRGL